MNKPSEAIIDRAIELWARMLVDPKYDNGDKSLNGALGMGLMHTNSDNNSSDEVLEKFKGSLKTILEKPTERGYFDTWLNVDYQPCEPLAQAAEEAGLTTRFPVKTSMQLNDYYVSVSYGYGAEDVNHYPLPDGKWLVTTLAGSEISKIIDFIGGDPLEFTVEG